MYVFSLPEGWQAPNFAGLGFAGCPRVGAPGVQTLSGAPPIDLPIAPFDPPALRPPRIQNIVRSTESSGAGSVQSAARCVFQAGKAWRIRFAM